MFKIAVMLCRWLFTLYISLFMAQGAKYIMIERGLIKGSGALCVSVQRVSIIFMHLTGFLILAYKPGEFLFDWLTLALGGAGLFFFLGGQFAVDKIYKKGCPLMWNCVFFLMDAGFITLARLDIVSARKQIIWFGVGFAATLLLPLALKFAARSERFELPYLLASLALVASPLAFGERSGGALNWININGWVNFQPSEIVKFSYVIYMAAHFARKNRNAALTPTIFTAVIVCVLTYQRDLGGALIFFMTFMSVLYIATGNVALVAAGLGAACMASVVAFSAFEHVRTRVFAWRDPWADVSDAGYQIVQSLFAIASGRLTGAGLTLGSASYVPVVKSDFIFAAICEEFGAIFGIGVVAAFLTLFYRGAHVALRCANRYYALLAAGFTCVLAFQTFIILGGVTKFIPLTGVTLPFVSYGGSSMLVSVMMIGILQWIYIMNRKTTPIV
ncbi:MAG: FtsW/RodA/SpoVE family cell cycle protein [Clostridiales bacterium]|jgi:cell division protein FtsW (lipid II flippase)|nr:FtsW/RodA/SpoVE family cell cycle protein [Clostridiales bacterium]